jgi:hypothetical protein
VVYVFGEEVGDELAEVTIRTLLDQLDLGFVVKLFGDVDAYLDVAGSGTLALRSAGWGWLLGRGGGVDLRNGGLTAGGDQRTELIGLGGHCVSFFRVIGKSITRLFAFLINCLFE